MAADRSAPHIVAVLSSAVFALATSPRKSRSAHGRSYSGALDAAASSSVESRTCDGAPNAGRSRKDFMPHLQRLGKAAVVNSASDRRRFVRAARENPSPLNARPDRDRTRLRSERLVHQLGRRPSSRCGQKLYIRLDGSAITSTATLGISKPAGGPSRSSVPCLDFVVLLLLPRWRRA